MLAVVYGCERFHTYIFGKRIIVDSDHKSLEMILLKNLAEAPQPLQRLCLRIQPYDMRITDRPGKDKLIADAPSGLRIKDASIIDLGVVSRSDLSSTIIVSRCYNDLNFF